MGFIFEIIITIFIISLLIFRKKLSESKFFFRFFFNFKGNLLEDHVGTEKGLKLVTRFGILLLVIEAVIFIVMFLME